MDQHLGYVKCLTLTLISYFYGLFELRSEKNELEGFEKKYLILYKNEFDSDICTARNGISISSIIEI